MRKRGYRRTPKNYQGTASTNHHLQDLLPTVLSRVGEAYKERPDLVLAAWKQVVGPQLAPMTEAVSFVDGVLLVKVKNSSLYGLLRQYERPKLLKKLRERFPQTRILNIIFRAG
jgi:predicted nucleic acid-binding Zn ribbon protein